MMNDLYGKEYKDPTLINQAKRQAQEEVEKISSKIPSSKVNQESINKHLEWLRQCPYLQYCTDSVCLDGINIVVPSPENNLRGNSVPAFPNAAELKLLLSTPNGKVVDNSDLVIQYKSEFAGHMGKVFLNDSTIDCSSIRASARTNQ